MKKNMRKNIVGWMMPWVIAMACMVPAACADMLDMGNDDVIYADINHLTEGNDTVNSFVGILQQLQKIAVRTNLMGELRGDLVVVNDNANTDLKEISSFSVNDTTNQYNTPRDYYAVINNCNYYLANADTSLHEQRYAGQSSYLFYIFRSEWVAVKAIRAWLYLQLGQIYGSNIPLVTTPILSIQDADEALASAPKMDIAGLCNYFIEDLKPYVGWFAYPYHGNPSHSSYGNDTPSRASVLPIQLVLGDLYLWRASLTKNPEDARLAAKSYYDYIDWIPSEGGITQDKSSYKMRTATYLYQCSWNTSCFVTGNFNEGAYSNATSTWFNTSKALTQQSEIISVISMERTAGQKNYNTLPVLYSYDPSQTDVEASISPSAVNMKYSDESVYYTSYNVGTEEKYGIVSPLDLSATMLEKHFIGDLRYPLGYAEVQRNDNDYLSQTIYKVSDAKEVVVYRVGEIYLRLAEALNYAGFPKFALAILTTGLDANVVREEVLDYCTNATDSAFVDYFKFSTLYYRSGVAEFSQFTDVVGMEYLKYPSMLCNVSTDGVNQVGIHSRGSGSGLRQRYFIENSVYYPTSVDIPSDFTGYPVDSTQCTDAEFKLLAEQYQLVEPKRSDYASTQDYDTALEAYQNNIRLLKADIRERYLHACMEWYRQKGLPQVKNRQMAVVDSLIDAEQALESCYEGNRFGSLARAAYRSSNPDAYMSQKLSRRDPSLAGLTRDRWFLRWNGQIGGSLVR